MVNRNMYNTSLWLLHIHVSLLLMFEKRRLKQLSFDFTWEICHLLDITAVAGHLAWLAVMIRKTAKPCINSTWIALLIHGFVLVKTWLLIAVQHSFLCNYIRIVNVNNWGLFYLSLRDFTLDCHPNVKVIHPLSLIEFLFPSRRLCVCWVKI